MKGDPKGSFQLSILFHNNIVWGTFDKVTGEVIWVHGNEAILHNIINLM